MIKAILAHDDTFGIGKNNSLPWPRNSSDLRYFKNLTKGHVIVMGRKTWDSISPKPLHDRINVVVTSSPHSIIGADAAYSTEKESLQIVLNRLWYCYPDKDIWIIGGASLLSQSLEYVSEIHLTHIPGDYGCDTHLDMEAIRSRFEIDSVTTNLEGTSFTVMKIPPTSL